MQIFNSRLTYKNQFTKKIMQMLEIINKLSKYFITLCFSHHFLELQQAFVNMWLQ